MESAFYLVLAPWFVFIVFAFIAKLLIHFARKKRGVAIAFGVLVQMFSPDPFVEKTIEAVTVENRQQKKQHDSKVIIQPDE